MSKPMAVVVEDDKDLALIFRKAMQISGFEAEAYYDAQSAIDRLQEIVPTLVILDMHLPGDMDGRSVLRYIRQQPQLKAVKVIVATADQDITYGEVNQSADIVLLKPVGFQKLQRIASQWRDSQDTESET